MICIKCNLPMKKTIINPISFCSGCHLFYMPSFGTNSLDEYPESWTKDGEKWFSKLNMELSLKLKELWF